VFNILENYCHDYVLRPRNIKNEIPAFLNSNYHTEKRSKFRPQILRTEWCSCRRNV